MLIVALCLCLCLWFWLWLRGKGTTSVRRAEVVDILRRHWRAALAAAIERVDSNVLVGGRDVVAVLQTLSPAQFLALDRALRVGAWSEQTARDAHTPNATRLIAPGTRRPDADAFLVVCAAHPDGFIRERALVTLHDYPGPLALATALIRCDDWVPEVRVAASLLLAALTSNPVGGSVFAQLESLLLLRRRGRFAAAVWQQHIEPQLLAPTRADERWTATAIGNAEARLFALELVVRVDRQRIAAAWMRAIDDGHPDLALWALQQAARQEHHVDASMIVDGASKHARAVVRAEALRCALRLDFADGQARLQAGVFDIARGPRNAAAYLLRERFHVSALALWRNAIDTAHPQCARIAVAALGEHAEACDESRLLPWLSHPTPRVRASALRAMSRIKSVQSLSHLFGAVLDPSPRVVGQAIELLAQSGEPVEQAWLERAYAHQRDPRLRARIIRGVRLLGRWETLAVLLRWSGVADDDTMFPVIVHQTERWLDSQHHRFTPLDNARRVELLDLLARANVHSPHPIWRRVTQLLDAA